MIWSGDGSGDGYGSGSGYGHGYGDGYGHGYGSGDGDGYGHGYGYGHGDWDGDGYGHGNESGDGVKIGKIVNFDIIYLFPFPYLKIGCEIHSVDYWRQNWKSLAKNEGLKISDIIDSVDKILSGWDRMQEDRDEPVL